jgi:enterochelin esterase-like enzyme
VVTRGAPVVLVLLALVACAAALAGCGAAARAGVAQARTVTDGATPPAARASRALPPAQPTGSGAALDTPYYERCAASLASQPRWRVRGHGTVTVFKLRSPDTSQTVRRVWVYRPGGVPDGARLPVVYYLHGDPGDGAGLWTQRDTAGQLDAQFAGGARPFVVVSMDGSGTKHSDSEWADSVDGADRVESFLLDRVIPAVEGRHRRDACHRAVVGFSMGGYGAVNLAQRHPDAFGQSVSIAGYFHVDDPDRVFGRDPAVERANSPDRQVARMKGLRVFLLDGGQENLELVKGEADRLAGLMIDDRITVVLNYSPGEHSDDYAFAQLPSVSAFLEAGWTPRPV